MKATVFLVIIFFQAELAWWSPMYHQIVPMESKADCQRTLGEMRLQPTGKTASHIVAYCGPMPTRLPSRPASEGSTE